MKVLGYVASIAIMLITIPIIGVIPAMILGAVVAGINGLLMARAEVNDMESKAVGPRPPSTNQPSDPKQTHYDILEVSRAASQQVIRAAYKSLMQRYHPDKAGNDPLKVEQAMKIRQAYEVLSDPSRQTTYDRELDAVAQAQQAAPSPPTKAVNEQPVQAKTERKNHSQSATPTVDKQKGTTQPLDPAAKKGAVRILAICVGVAILLILLGQIEARLERKARAEAVIQQAEHKEKQLVMQRAEEAIARAEEAKVRVEEAKARTARTVSHFVTNLTTYMPPSPSGFNSCTSIDPCKRYIFIPSISVEFQEKNAYLLMRTLARNRDLVLEAVTRRLQREQYTRLIGVDADRRLASIVAEEINIALLSDSFPSDGGVAQVLLPQSFSIK